MTGCEEKGNALLHTSQTLAENLFLRPMTRDMLAETPIFEDLNNSQLDLLRPIFTPCCYETESMLFEQGDPADHLFLVLEGEVTIRFKPDDAPVITVTRVRRGGIVGWSAAVGSPSYTSGAFCSPGFQALRVRGDDLRALCEKYPDTGVLVLERLAEVIAERLQNTHEHVLKLLKNGMRNNGALSREV
jgi:CRP-like cAMP-binding protein